MPADPFSPTTDTLLPPNGAKEVLLHSCCAPCSGELIETMKKSGLTVTLFYYNPNIYPEREYRLRHDESKRFTEQMGITFVDEAYAYSEWKARTTGLENEPERGERCRVCFDIRFEATAEYAHDHGFKVFTSGLGISRWKDMEMITSCGIRAAAHYPGLIYWDYNWRKDGGSQRMYEISKREHFYKQEYCGCEYSLRDANAWRVEHGKEPIITEKEYY
jgi:predicted adenine nucleotide alpha hydrolase (AANH) superfamily ATPase